MTGLGGLFDFIIAIVSLIGVGALFFVAIERFAPDATFKKIAQIAIGVVLIIALLLALKGVFFGGGALAVAPLGIVYFAIGLLVALVVVFLVYLMLDWLAGQQDPPNRGWVGPVKYVIGAIALIALLLLAANTMFNAKIGDMRRGERDATFQLAGGAPASLPAAPS